MGMWPTPHTVHGSVIPEFLDVRARMRLREFCLFANFFSNKCALHIRAALLTHPKVIYAIPGDVCDVACGTGILVTGPKTVVAAP